MSPGSGKEFFEGIQSGNKPQNYCLQNGESPFGLEKGFLEAAQAALGWNKSPCSPFDLPDRPQALEVGHQVDHVLFAEGGELAFGHEGHG